MLSRIIAWFRPRRTKRALDYGTLRAAELYARVNPREGWGGPITVSGVLRSWGYEADAPKGEDNSDG